MTATQTPPRPKTKKPPKIHYKIVGGTRMYCIQPACDGQHHVWCNCVSWHAH